MAATELDGCRLLRQNACGNFNLTLSSMARRSLWTLACLLGVASAAISAQDDRFDVTNVFVIEAFECSNVPNMPRCIALTT